MIGSFPPPIHGMSLANEILLNHFKKEHFVIFLDTKTSKDIGNFSQQGRMSFKRIFNSFFHIFIGTGRIIF